MATFQDRFPKNVPGKYYIDAECTDCDYCRECAPNNIRRDDEHGYSYVFHQPVTAEEIAACKEGAEGCPTHAVGSDGDQHDWWTSPIYDWTAYSESLRPFLEGLQTVPSSAGRAAFFHYIRKLFS